MKEVLEITNQTQKERKDLMIESFIYWAGKNTDTKTQYQVVLTYAPIRRWFFLQYERLEKEFVDFINKHPKGSTKENERLYNRMTGRIYDLYPSVLLEGVKKKFKGIPIYNLN